MSEGVAQRTGSRGGAPPWGDLRRSFDLAAVVTVAVVVPSPARGSLIATVALALLAAGVVLVPAVRRSPWTWGAFAGYHIVTYALAWYRLDNHDALIAYWAGALAIAAVAADRDRMAALQARWMLGATFLLAAGWKLLSSQFLSGDFFTYTLLVDTRFGAVTRLVTGVTPAQVAANGRALAEAATALDPGPVVLDGVGAVADLAMVLTVMTIVVEAAVAISMLWSHSASAERARSIVLAAFLVATYLLVPVSRFGLVLAAMGIAQAEGHRRIRVGFAVGAAGLFAWGSIWEALSGAVV